MSSELDDSLLSDGNVSQAPKRRKADKDKVSDFDTSSEESSESEAESLVRIHMPRHHNTDKRGRTQTSFHEILSVEDIRSGRSEPTISISDRKSG